ncbi:hypothetical protein FJT64_009938 [Amphibalanus amphitrite]|uniref:Peptidase A2 domain-containing protein n=1 Tax=Amphibalanus amphitrite TaxID=1232801 RepID=A0A6A4VKE1_AMPAM|nr:hypothetical protein FJT64_009938 [Amphibalanus amphitrite]
MGADSESDLKQKRTQARGKATRLLKELEDCDKTQEDDLALAIHHLEEHIKVMSEIQREMTIREEASTRKRGGTSDSTDPVPGSGKPTVSVLSLRRKRDPDWVCLACGSAGPRGVRLVRALIDGGSDASFIRSSLADELGLETVGQGTFACVGFKEELEEARQYDLVSAQLRGHQREDAAEKTMPGPTWSEEEKPGPVSEVCPAAEAEEKLQSSVACSHPVTRTWRHRRRVCDHLNRRWTSEYLSALRCWSTSPRGRPSRLPGIGDVVLVRQDGPRGRRGGRWRVSPRYCVGLTDRLAPRSSRCAKGRLGVL